tara:strand:+ start:58 stop:426 length:369 start_codon:yes stop_codon:yes gene_type:complete
MFEALKNYADFNGRARRKEYWLFYLFVILGYIVTAVIDLMTGTLDEMSGVGILSGLFFLGVIIPNLAVTIRRLHDQDRSGWWILIGVIPLVGPLVLFVFMCLPGTTGDNRFGADPILSENFS